MWWLAPSLYNKKGIGSNLPNSWGIYCGVFPVWVLPQSKDMNARLIGDSKLPVGENVSMSVQDVPHLLPCDSQYSLQNKCDLGEENV